MSARILHLADLILRPKTLQGRSQSSTTEWLGVVSIHVPVGNSRSCTASVVIGLDANVYSGATLFAHVEKTSGRPEGPAVLAPILYAEHAQTPVEEGVPSDERAWSLPPSEEFGRCAPFDWSPREAENKSHLEAALAAARQGIVTRDRMTSLASHDLRGPLMVLRATLEVLRLQTTPAFSASEEGHLSRAERQIQKMEKLLDELLDVSCLLAGREVTLRRIPTDLVPLIQELTTEYARTASEHRFTLTPSVASLVGRWDPDRLERVVGNLLSNATKYSAPGTEIVIEVDRQEREEPCAVLRVHDRGIGVAEEDYERIFDWFARGDGAGRHVAGFGVGLAGARRIVELHGGVITLGRREGGGSTFTVTLPLRTDAA